MTKEAEDEEAIKLAAVEKAAAENVSARREKWRHEDELINHRLTWLLASQTLLLGAYGLLVQKLTEWYFCPTKQQLEHLILLLKAIPCVGALLSLALAVGVIAAVHAMRVLSIFETSNHLTPSYVSAWAKRGGWIAGLSLPFIFLGTWGWIFFNQTNLGGASGFENCYPARALEAEKSKPSPAPSLVCSPAVCPPPAPPEEKQHGRSRKRSGPSD